MKLTSEHPLWSKGLVALLAGAAAPFSFSPHDFWPAGLISVLVLVLVLQRCNPRQSLLVGWIYGIGFFGLGVSWVYVSIHVYGNAGPPLAALLTALLVMGLALLFSLQCWCWRRFFSAAVPALTFAALWVLFEWLRSWLLTGFPWLYLGSAHIHSPLAGLPPVTGVMGASFVVALSGAVCAFLLPRLIRGRAASPRLLLPLGAMLMLWAAAWGLSHVSWVEPEPGANVPVALVQGNIDQSIKFDPLYIQEILDRYEAMSEPLWDNTMVFWPETAVPLLYQQAEAKLEEYARRASTRGGTLITGILYRNGERIHNSIISLGEGSGIYHKQRLVPFGEYVPFESITAGLLQLFELPMSSLSPGPPEQPLLRAAGLSLAPYICYEVAYADFVRDTAREADILVTISNDTWFGASWGPLQHLQIAAMRALENGRYMVRATNNGVSAIIDERGNIVRRSGQFRAEVLEGEVRLFAGATPFSRWGSLPLLLFCAACLIFSLARRATSP